MIDKQARGNVLIKSDFISGWESGMPIALGYIPVAFTFGLLVVSGGLSPWIAVLASATNFTSAGQVAGIRLILAGAGYFEIALTTVIINLRYLLMSLSLTQKVDPQLSFGKRLICSFGITDETFSVAAIAEQRLSFPYFVGLMLGPFFAWVLGTAVGAWLSMSLSLQLRNALGIALYAMFIALIIPPAKREKSVLVTILISVMVTVILRYAPLFQRISSGFSIIIATIIASAVAAVLWPVSDDDQMVKEDFHG